jgi:predicted CoA-binding protein
MNFEARPTLTFVGCSGTPGKAAHDVPLHMRDYDFPVVPVNPRLVEWEGQPAFANLNVASSAQNVVVFRPAEEAPEIARAAVLAGAKSLWLQLGIRSAAARTIAEDAGLDYVEDKCIWVEFRKFAETR